MSPLLQQILSNIDKLTLEEQFLVINHTTEALKVQTLPKVKLPEETRRRSWKELRHSEPNALDSQDA